MDDINYSLYLVTGRDLLPPGKDYFQSLEESLQGGVSVVQIREKKADTAEFLDIARRSKAVCDKYNVPILINDRVDVAIAINARGVHLGQTDMSIATARSLLPEGAIIGVSCNNENHVRAAIQDGVDYVGIGAVWGTQTKQLTSPVIGVRGVGKMLEILDGTEVKAVAIGGIKTTNLLRTLHGCVSTTDHALDGVAVVSDIVASKEPRVVAEKFTKILEAFRAINFGLLVAPRSVPSKDQILASVNDLINTVRKTGPLVHQITNTVVATQSANITLALGASPIMATEPQEMGDLSRICGALLVNIGTMRSDGKESMTLAGYHANMNKKPVVFDPVGVGASAFRKETVKDLLNTWQASVIKGNAGELASIAGSTEVASKGVDSVGSGFSDPSSFVRALAKKERCVVVLTGPVDYISDGVWVAALRNGHEILRKFTGSGCIVGSSIATYCAAAVAVGRDTENTDGRLVYGDMFIGAIAGVLVLTVAAEIAAKREDVKGPGTFLPALIDELWVLTPSDVLSMARIDIC
ncbi:thiamine biosynthetic bifunctional enzyme [Collybia nuda]|uniref:Thiamine biosynthetic bifunctional enzyme n=1 Tax=Collybia nuda TaxID=64659 RepID=A0A9P5Y2K9_9AGAR|nr:thiamine biosynthetic bifunctional enzyme [Collybia nuda]